MHNNLLIDPLITVRKTNTARVKMSLPEVLAAAAADEIDSFELLRPHQAHAWHALLVQLWAAVTDEATARKPPVDPAGWSRMLSAAIPGYGDDPWELVIDDWSRPAFLQCPDPANGAGHRMVIAEPDGLDILVTAKNHDVKRRAASTAAPEDWLYALASVQGQAPYLGAGNYGVSRMKHGSSSRPCIGLAPAHGGIGAHIARDARLLREDILRIRGTTDRPDPSTVFLWLEPWDGESPTDPRELTPGFIEISRRIRLDMLEDGTLTARKAKSQKARVERRGPRTPHDHWTPRVSEDGAPMSVTNLGFRYDRLAHFALPGEGRTPAPAMRVEPTETGPFRIVARAVAGGKGRTHGFHTRTDVVLSARTAQAVCGDPSPATDRLAATAKKLLEQVFEVSAAVAAGHRAATRFDRDAAAAEGRRAFDLQIDNPFWTHLEARFLAEGADEEAAARNEAAVAFAEIGRDVLRANSSRDTRAPYGQRATATSLRVFEARLRREGSAYAALRIPEKTRETPAHHENTTRPHAGPEENRADSPTPSNGAAPSPATTATPADTSSNDRMPFAKAAPIVAARIAGLRPGPAAELRRCCSNRRAAPFLNFVMKNIQSSGTTEDWKTIVQAIAILTPKGRKRPRSAHHPGRALGQALKTTGVSESRLTKLLALPAERRGRAAMTLCRRLSAHGIKRIDCGCLAGYILDDEKADAEIARGYHYRTTAAVPEAAA